MIVLDVMQYADDLKEHLDDNELSEDQMMFLMYIEYVLAERRYATIH